MDLCKGSVVTSKDNGVPQPYCLALISTYDINSTASGGTLSQNSLTLAISGLYLT